MNIGQRVREAREDLGMQRTVLARRVGVAENTIYRIETAKRMPSVELLEKIARELRTEPAEFLREPVPVAEGPEGLGRAEVEGLIARIQRNLDTLRGYMEHPPDEDAWDSALDAYFHLMEGGGPLHMARQLLEQEFKDRQLLVRLIRVTEEYVLISSQLEAFNLTQYGHRHRDAG
jgi:transcriptional regulator with XRE-family HTH domain